MCHFFINQYPLDHPHSHSHSHSNTLLTKLNITHVNLKTTDHSTIFFNL
jgi:hypothetical protein